MQTKELENLLERITNLTINLEKEVAELKEDTIVNASHIHLIEVSNKDKLNNMHSSMKQINDATNEFVNDLEKEMSNIQTDNYTDFLKTLLKEDFIALQKEMLEDTKRELLNSTNKTTKNENLISSFLKHISPVLSIVSFVLLIIICMKFKLFGMLFQ